MSPGHCPQLALELECPFSLLCGYLLRVATSFSKENFCSTIPSPLPCFIFHANIYFTRVCSCPSWNFCPQGAIISHMLRAGTGRDCCGGPAGENPPASTGDASSVLGSGRSLEKEMATHSSILAWRIPWTEEPGGPQSVGLQVS